MRSMSEQSSNQENSHQELRELQERCAELEAQLEREQASVESLESICESLLTEYGQMAERAAVDAARVEMIKEQTLSALRDRRSSCLERSRDNILSNNARRKLHEQSLEVDVVIKIVRTLMARI